MDDLGLAGLRLGAFDEDAVGLEGFGGFDGREWAASGGGKLDSGVGKGYGTSTSLVTGFGVISVSREARGWGTTMGPALCKVCIHAKSLFCGQNSSLTSNEGKVNQDGGRAAE